MEAIEDQSKHFDDLLHEMKELNKLRIDHPDKFNSALTLLTGEISRIWEAISANGCDEDGDDFVEQRAVVLTEKIPIPDTGNGQDRRGRNCNLIGRLLGPSGISLRQLEADTSCRIVIRGAGSIHDVAKEKKLRGTVGWEHLDEPLHVFVKSTDKNRKKCEQRLREAVDRVKKLLEPCDDFYKKKQLVQLAIIKGTYRPEGLKSETGKKKKM